MLTSSQRAVRQQYLNKLGIVQYVAKDSSNALSEKEVQEFTSDAESLAVGNSPDTSSMLEALDESTAGSRGKKERVETKPTSEKLDIQLRFALWEPADDLLVCCVIDEPLPEQQEIKLLTNIIAAMDNQVTNLPAVDVITWPPYSNMLGDEAEIRDFFSTVINTRVKTKSSKTLLLMGGPTQQWLLNSEQIEQSDDGIVQITDSLTGLLVPSLQEMLVQPELKRMTWQVICRHRKPTG